jgi:hypothetical protein
MSAEETIREAIARIVAGPPDNGVSQRRALDALERLVAERDALVRASAQAERALWEETRRANRAERRLAEREQA